MDTRTAGVSTMKTRLFYTTGNRDIIETIWDKPEPNSRQIEVKNIITGVCRSDIDMYTGAFQTLPKEIQGHEGLGIVTKVGNNIYNVNEGDIVATRGEPSFADYYNANENTYVKVPSTDPKYIIEPVACGINIYEEVSGSIKFEDDIIILGTGFLAQVIYETIRNNGIGNNIVIVGRANKKYWKLQNVELCHNRKNISPQTSFDIIFDLSDDPDYLENLISINDEAIIVLAAEKHPAAILPMSKLLWKAVTIIFPSPRNANFIEAMKLAVDLIDNGIIDTESMWTQEYKRDTEVKAAFEDGLNRTRGYSRGYIRW